MKIWLYQGRNGQTNAYSGTHEGFAAARVEQDWHNKCTPEEAKKMGLEVGGSEAEGHYYIDDGGDITLLEVEEV